MRYFKIITVLVFLIVNPIMAQEKLTKEERLEWFQDAKLGIFIHWGVYSVPAFENEWHKENSLPLKITIRKLGQNCSKRLAHVMPY